MTCQYQVFSRGKHELIEQNPYICSNKRKDLFMKEWNSLARSYNVLDTAYSLKNTLQSYFQDENFSEFSKLELHEYINKVLLKNYDGEEVIKYILTKDFLKKKVTAAFEVNILESRADFITVNGDTKSFEIKSNLDSLLRIEKQTFDYSKVFEYNYTVTGEKHFDKLENLLPSFYGIWIINSKNRLQKIKEATLSPYLCPTSQLNLFTKKELKHHFSETDLQEIMQNFTPEDINGILKINLKKRYKKRWDFIKENHSEILPFHYQFFFNKNLSPKIVYNSL